MVFHLYRASVAYGRRMADIKGAAYRAFDEAREKLVALPDPPADGRPLAVRIAVVFSGAIRQGMYRQGQPLPPAAAIARRFNTSVDTARVAIRALVAAGLVRREPGGAAYVTGRATPPQLR